MSVELNAPHDPVLRASVRQRATVLGWVDTVAAGIAVWEPRPMPPDYTPEWGDVRG